MALNVIKNKELLETRIHLFLDTYRILLHNILRITPLVSAYIDPDNRIGITIDRLENGIMGVSEFLYKEGVRRIANKESYDINIFTLSKEPDFSNVNTSYYCGDTIMEYGVHNKIMEAFCNEYIPIINLALKHIDMIDSLVPSMRFYVCLSQSEYRSEFMKKHNDFELQRRTVFDINKLTK